MEGYPPVPLCVLCSKCLEILGTQPEFVRENIDTDHYSSTPRSHHPSEVALRNSASAGCVLCQLVLAQFIGMRICNKDGEHRASLAGGVCYAVRLTFAEDITLRFYATSLENWSAWDDPSTGKAQSPALSFFLDHVDCAKSPLSPELIAPQKENTTTGTLQCLNLAKHWLDTCERHATCRHAVPGMETRPRRLIQIWKSKDTLKARLCQDVLPGVRYATLSHRWGPDPGLRLLEANSEHLSQEIPIKALEQVFQDTIQVVWALGLTYVWIDTLCIKQDSPSDWAAQSAEMGAVYKNAVCNLASASSEDGTGGLFTNRDPFLHFSPHFRIRWSDVKLESKAAPISLKGYYILKDLARWRHNVSRAPLNQRGWVAQERELSPCILVFGRQQLFWKCGEILSCESFPRGIPGMETYNWNSDTRTFRNLIESKQKAKPDEDDVVCFWNAFVHRYSATDLTRKRDRLPATFGMARELLRLMPGNTFLAGLWESHLTEGLLWRVDQYSDKGASEKAGVATILSDFQVPSWSWASLDRAVMCDPHRINGKFQLLATAVSDGLRNLDEHEDGDSNPFVVCNRLKVTSPRLSDLADVLERATDPGQGLPRLRVFPDIVDGQRVASRPDIRLPKIDDDDEHPADGTINQRKLSVDTRVLPILLVPHWDVIIGLLVNPSGCGERNTYSRVGTFEAWFKDRASLRAIFCLPENTDSGTLNLGKVTADQRSDMETICLV